MSDWINGNLVGTLSVGQGERGKSLEYMWRGTELGIRQEGEEEYQFVNLAGEKGDKGDRGISKDITKGYKEDFKTPINPMIPTLYCSSSTNIENAVKYPAIIDNKPNTIFRYSTTPIQASNLYPQHMCSNVVGRKAYTLEFMADCSELELLVYKNNLVGYLVVDDILVSDKFMATSVGNGLYSIINFKFDKHKTRHIKFYLGANSIIYGVNVDSRGSIYSFHEERFKVVFDGDSITEGAVSSFPNIFGYAGRVARRFNWDLVNCAYGGTGFVNPGLNGRVPIGERIDTVVKPHNPNIFAVCCGLNDSSEKYAEGYRVAIPKYFSDLKEKLADTEIIVISPFCPTNNVNTLGSLAEINTLCKENALANGFPYIDIINGTTYDKHGKLLIDGLGGIITGKGTVGKPSPTGNRSLYMSDDGTHPVNEGYEYLAYRIIMEILRLYKSL